MMTLSGAARRMKGVRFEREIARKLRPWFPDARRGLQYRDGSECPDIVGTPFWIECKRHRAVTVSDFNRWFARACEVAVHAINDFPDGVVMVVRSDHEQIMVFVDKRESNDCITWPEFEEYLDAEYGRRTE